MKHRRTTRTRTHTVTFHEGSTRIFHSIKSSNSMRTEFLGPTPTFARVRAPRSQLRARARERPARYERSEPRRDPRQTLRTDVGPAPRIASANLSFGTNKQREPASST